MPYCQIANLSNVNGFCTLSKIKQVPFPTSKLTLLQRGLPRFLGKTFRSLLHPLLTGIPFTPSSASWQSMTLSFVSSMSRPLTVAQKTVSKFCHFEQTCTNLTLTTKPALKKIRVIVLHLIYNLVPYMPDLDKY